jgi:hypothetical protein
VDANLLLPDISNTSGCAMQGVHYGMFAGAGNPPTTVWTAIRPHNWRPTTNKEFLVEFDMVSGGTVTLAVMTC